MKPFLFLRRLLGLLITASLALAQTPVRPPAKFDESKAPPYRITRGDVLAVSVYGESDLTVGNKKVEPKGTIVLPLLQEVRVSNLTILEAQTMIENAYRDGRYLRNPVVTVTIEQYAPRVVSISGKVNAPGRYELPPDQQWTLKDLILRANGFSDTAKGSDVRVTRTMPDGTIKTFSGLDVDSVLRARAKTVSEAATFILEPDDIVYVPEKII